MVLVNGGGAETGGDGVLDLGVAHGVVMEVGGGEGLDGLDGFQVEGDAVACGEDAVGALAVAFGGAAGDEAGAAVHDDEVGGDDAVEVDDFGLEVTEVESDALPWAHEPDGMFQAEGEGCEAVGFHAAGVDEFVGGKGDLGKADGFQVGSPRGDLSPRALIEGVDVGARGFGELGHAGIPEHLGGVSGEG